MSITFRNYHHPEDYLCISEFLIRHHQPGNRDGNWIEPIWEYMHSHPYLDGDSLERIGIWEDDGEIVAAAHYESRLGEAFFQFHPACRHLREAMLDHAERSLRGRRDGDGAGYLRALVNDFDREFQSLVKARGFERNPRHDRPLAGLAIPDPFPAIELPAGYRLTSLADEPDWAKVQRVMWRGFNHGDDVPMDAEDLESRRRMFDTPKARRELKVAVVAPSGDFASFCGMFFEPEGKLAYVEPVATDPDHRRLGLGRAAVLEGIRRCRDLGATITYVGSSQEFYLSLGFEIAYTSECWVRRPAD